MSRIRIILYLILMVLSLIYCFFYRDYIFVFGRQKLSLKPVLILAAICAIIIIIYIIMMLIFKKFNPKLYKKLYKVLFESENEEFDGDKYINDLRSKIIIFKEDNKEKNKDILELMLENMKEIKDYYVISKKQANKSFTLAVSMCIVGLCFIAASIVLAFVTDLSFGITLIPAIGGSIAELIAGTSLVVYKSSVEQLNNYYKALHNNERFLSLVNIVSKVSPEMQDDVYINIINIELQNYRNHEN